MGLETYTIWKAAFNKNNIKLQTQNQVNFRMRSNPKKFRESWRFSGSSLARNAHAKGFQPLSGCFFPIQTWLAPGIILCISYKWEALYLLVKKSSEILYDCFQYFLTFTRVWIWGMGKQLELRTEFYEHTTYCKKKMVGKPSWPDS